MSRPYSLFYVAMLGVLGHLAVTEDSGAFKMFQAGMIGPSIWILGVVLNDYLHRRRDAVGRPERTQKKGLFFYGFCFGGLAFTFLLAVSSMPTMGYCFLAFLFSALYGMLKCYPGLASVFRGMAGGAVVLASTQQWIPSFPVWCLAVGVSLMDASGNILGDYRDLKIDLASGTKTLATTLGKMGLLMVLGFHAIAIVAFHQAFHLSMPMVFGLVGLGWIPFLMKDAFKHIAYLLWKYFVVLVVLGFYHQYSLVYTTMVFMVASVGWYFWIHKTIPSLPMLVEHEWQRGKRRLRFWR